jgi:hypothetical protein
VIIAVPTAVVIKTALEAIRVPEVPDETLPALVETRLTPETPGVSKR